MKKSVLGLKGVEVLSKRQMKNVGGGEDGEKRPRGCKTWRIKLFGYTLVEHNNDECQNSDGNWDWGGNGDIPNEPNSPS